VRILHIATGYPIGYPGGVTNYVRALVANQRKAEHDVVVVSRSAEPQADLAGVDLWAYATSRMRPFSLSMLEHDPAADALLERIRCWQPDVVHFHMGLDLAIGFYKGLTNSGIPYIVSVHDYYTICPRITMVDATGSVCRTRDIERCRSCVGILAQHDILEKGSRIIGLPLPRIPSSRVLQRDAALREFLRCAALVLPVSRRVREILAEVEPTAKYVVETIGNSSALCERPRHVPSERMRITFLGTLSVHKGSVLLERILRRVGHSPTLEVRFHGRGDVKVLSRLKALGLKAMGPYGAADLSQIMSETDLGLALPIWEDNGPQVVMEFLNYGVPVLATRMGGIPDFVTDGVNGFLFNPDSEAEFEMAIAFLAKLDSTACEVLRPKGKLKTPAEHAGRIESLYRGVVA
jgi:glycosyltransferase involved in cell wall biosynthesis